MKQYKSSNNTPSAHYSVLLLNIIVLGFLLLYFLPKTKPIHSVTCPIKENTYSFKVSITKPVVQTRTKQVVKNIEKSPPNLVKRKKLLKKRITTKVIARVNTVGQKEQVSLTQQSKEEKQAIEKKEVIKAETKPLLKQVDTRAKELYIRELRTLISQQQKYPRKAKRSKKQGVCTIHFILEKSGLISQISLIQSSGHKILDKAALKLLESIKSYKPIPDNVNMVELTFDLPIAYHIK